ncbi:hypothetical protein TSOC_003451 [Tetrabaena socialis]|uniref:Uncharacterized protein n=1 Tax=Tetrabaena socialis TaxID=47790 RepID=A0A2J8ABK5_9CHLO|nr:hypothetical protein TSOC_003451 [Tetrabaena socialis]|eukprot:PNH09901.1 hypothetical protein TSOC_003451 [Tetrabaena socialis]
MRWTRRCRVTVDFEPLMAVAAMLYGTSFVAERYSGIRTFLEAGAGGGEAAGGDLARQAAVVDDERLMPVTRHIIAGSGGCGAEGGMRSASFPRVRARVALGREGMRFYELESVIP